MNGWESQLSLGLTSFIPRGVAGLPCGFTMRVPIQMFKANFSLTDIPPQTLWRRVKLCYLAILSAYLIMFDPSLDMIRLVGSIH